MPETVIAGIEAATSANIRRAIAGAACKGRGCATGL